jgi:hypothetical protein
MGLNFGGDVELLEPARQAAVFLGLSEYPFDDPHDDLVVAGIARLLDVLEYLLGNVHGADSSAIGEPCQGQFTGTV